MSKVLQGPNRALADLVAERGPVETAEVIRRGALNGELGTRLTVRAHLDSAERDLEMIAAAGGRLVSPDDPEWPAWQLLPFGRLDGADTAPPIALWVLGRRPLDELVERSVALVGTRAASAYGEQVTAEIAGDLAVDGWTIVSGAAFGVDGAAHRAALGVGGTTIAVLACGVDRSYPAGHARLLQSVAAGGLVVSEYAPGTTPAKHRFLARNRLVAGLSAGVVVVEAGWRSGARNTAAWGRKLGRPVAAVPGPVTSAASVGCNRMIRDGEAILVAGARDVVDVVGPLELFDGHEAVVTRDTDRLTGDMLLIYEALPAAGSQSAAELSETSGVPLPMVRALLPLLELEGFVGTDDTGWFRLRGGTGNRSGTVT
nr:DNA-processing protein DprA [Rhodococcus sp. HNM0569]